MKPTGWNLCDGIKNDAGTIVNKPLDKDNLFEVIPSAEFVYNDNFKSFYGNNCKNALSKFHQGRYEDINQMSYNYCLFWRYIYENHGGWETIVNVFKRFKGIQPTHSNIKTTMDAVLSSKGITYADALIDFTKHIYFTDNKYNNWLNNNNDFYSNLVTSEDKTRIEKITSSNNPFKRDQNGEVPKYTASECFASYPHEIYFDVSNSYEFTINKRPSGGTARAELNIQSYLMDEQGSIIKELKFNQCSTSEVNKYKYTSFVDAEKGFKMIILITRTDDDLSLDALYSIEAVNKSKKRGTECYRKVNMHHFRKLRM